MQSEMHGISSTKQCTKYYICYKMSQKVDGVGPSTTRQFGRATPAA